jgi:D-alanine-D-alanine ligase-like ATP-grasp enzyme
MPFVVYATPFFSDNATRNITALLDLEGVRLAVISQAPQEELDPAARARLLGHWQIDDALDAAALLAAARALAEQHGPIERLLSATEQVQVQLAEVREALGIAGMPVEVARNFRDKARMKEILRAAGLPCARHRLIADVHTALDFAGEVGYPLVIKPPAGAGSQATYRADDEADLHAALAAIDPQPEREALLEEFITGEEHSFDTWSIDGRPVFHSLTEYLPTPLDAMRNPWIQWAVLLPREVDDPRYDDIRAAAFGALRALGMDTGLSHMEWFRRADGSIAISEVAARPPGAQITTLMSRAHDFDSIAAWSRLMVYGDFTPPERQWAVGAAFLRGQGQGVVRALHGLEEATREVGHLITDIKLPTVGQGPSPSYEGEGFVVVRHPDTATVRWALSRLVSLIRVELG